MINDLHPRSHSGFCLSTNSIRGTTGGNRGGQGVCRLNSQLISCGQADHKSLTTPTRVLSWIFRSLSAPSFTFGFLPVLPRYEFLYSIRSSMIASRFPIHSLFFVPFRVFRSTNFFLQTLSSMFRTGIPKHCSAFPRRRMPSRPCLLR